MISRKKLANSLRILSVDTIQHANSGHPGMPMGMADIAEVLWNDFLQHNPANPAWQNRDRFVISNGHGVALQYALLHLTGYDLSIDDLKQFRRLHSKTPGHPEYGVTPGVEVTTGPLGQGFASAVGMALAERLLAHRFNRDEFTIVDNYTYCFLGDGCLMEGLAHEAAALAGTLALGKLIVFWDDNSVCLDGPVANCSGEDIGKRFAAYNWHVLSHVNGHDPDAIKKAITTARQHTTQPTLICCKTTIGFGSPNFAGTARCHGTPLGSAEVALMRAELGWDDAKAFTVPADLYAAWDAKQRGANLEQAWQARFAAYESNYPYLAAEFLRCVQSQLPSNWSTESTSFIAGVQANNPSIATREASKLVLDFLGETLPELFGGAADLTNPTCTLHKHAKIITPSAMFGNYLRYGAREFAMSCIMNGISLYGGFIPYGGTFLTFSDYARSGIRSAAIMRKRVIYVLTHDSVGLGEDGPTHQPVEHLAALRLMPNVSVWRPSDAIETAVAWTAAIENLHGPTVLALTRQTVQGKQRSAEQVANIRRGGYIIADSQEPAAIILLATGSELDLALAAQQLATSCGYHVRVVSMPSVDVFLAQSAEYQASVLPSATPKIVIEAGVTAYWQQFVAGNGKVIGIDCYGNSAPWQDLYNYFSLTAANIFAAIEEVLAVKA